MEKIIKRIYELALEKIEKHSSECIFIDNSVKNLEVANELQVSKYMMNAYGAYRRWKPIIDYITRLG